MGSLRAACIAVATAIATATTASLPVVYTNASGPERLLDRVGFFFVHALGDALMELAAGVHAAVDLAGKVAVALDAVEEAQPRLVHIEVVRMEARLLLGGVCQDRLSLVSIQMARPCTCAARDIYKKQ